MQFPRQRNQLIQSLYVVDGALSVSRTFGICHCLSTKTIIPATNIHANKRFSQFCVYTFVIKSELQLENHQSSHST